MCIGFLCVKAKLFCVNASVSQASVCKSSFLRAMALVCKRLSDSKSFLTCRRAEMSWEELRWDEMRWSVECEVWSVSATYDVWRARCEVWSVEFQVRPLEQCIAVAQSKHARAWLAHSACKFYRWKRCYSIESNPKAASAPSRAGTTGVCMHVDTHTGDRKSIQCLSLTFFDRTSVRPLANIFGPPCLPLQKLQRVQQLKSCLAMLASLTKIIDLRFHAVSLCTSRTSLALWLRISCILLGPNTRSLESSSDCQDEQCFVLFCTNPSPTWPNSLWPYWTCTFQIGATMSHYTFVGLRHTTPFSPIARVRPVLLWHPVAVHMAQRETSRRTSVLNGSPGSPGSPPWRGWHALMNWILNIY